MTDSISKEYLLVDQDPETVLSFVSFLKTCGLEDKLIHIPNHEDAMNFLLDDAGDVKLIIVGITDTSEKPIEMIRQIKARKTLKYIPLVILTNFWGSTEVTATHEFLINALYFRPLDSSKFKRIIALAGNI